MCIGSHGFAWGWGGGGGGVKGKLNLISTLADINPDPNHYRHTR
jgi:hypothetical protein